MRQTQTEDDNFLLSFSDFKRIFKKWKSAIIKGTLLGAILAIAFTLLMPLKYLSEATFYEKAKSDSGSSNSGKNAALLLLGEERENSAIVMLRSNKVVEAAIQKLDLQASIEPYSPFPRVITKALKYARHPFKNLQVQTAYLTRNVYPSIEEQEPDLIANDVSYKGEVPRFLDIKFSSPDEFTVTCSVNGCLGNGRIGEHFHAQDLAFTLQPTQKKTLDQRRFELIVQPLRAIAGSIIKDLKVLSDYKDKSFITLSLVHTSRKGSSTLLNAIMEAYRDHLVEEHHRLVASQVGYLNQRREMMEKQLSTLMHERAEKMTTHAGNLELLIATQQTMQKKLLSIDLETKQIQKSLDEGSYVQANYISESDPPYVHQTVAEIRRFRHQTHSIELALNDLAKQQFSMFEFAPTQEFQGIDLETANTLYLNCCRELQEAQTTAIQNQFIIDKVGQSDFEISSLASILLDPVSSEIIKKASSVSLAMKDQGNRTQRELERLELDLDLQRKFLGEHLQQIVQLLKLRIELLYSKIQALHSVSKELLQQKIAIHENQLLEYAQSRLNTLKQERSLIYEQKQALQQEFDMLPEQWSGEKLLDLYLKTDGALMQHIGSLIESKNIADHLEVSLSAPFDLAIPPLHPKSPHIILYALLGAFLGGFGMTFFAIIYSVTQGIEATKKNLTIAGKHVSGSLSKGKDEEIESLRHLMAHLCSSDIAYDIYPHNTLLVLEGLGPDYAPELAILLTKRKQKVLIMNISFDSKESPSQNEVGLVDYLEGKISQVPILEGDYDVLPVGQHSNYGAELMESQAFHRVLKELESKYNWILVVCQTPLNSALAEIALSQFNRTAVTITNEKLHELTPYFKYRGKISFLV